MTWLQASILKSTINDSTYEVVSQSHGDKKWNGGSQGLGGVGMVRYCLMSTEFQPCKMKRVLDAQYECTEYYWAAYFKVVKKANFMLCVVHDNKKKLKGE